jgi:hypothetical protein
LALPTAIWVPASAAMPLTASWGSKAPGIFATSTWRAGAPAATMVMAGWRLCGPVVVALTTAPLPAMATPDTDSAAAAPKAWVCRQEAPFAETKAVRVRPACPVTTAPEGPPSAGPAIRPAGVVRVAWNVQAVPFGDR